MKPKLLIVVGPTASGKSELAVRLAKKLNGEIISADSRQIYRGLDIGSGKVAGNWQAWPMARHLEPIESPQGKLREGSSVRHPERSEGYSVRHPERSEGSQNVFFERSEAESRSDSRQARTIFLYKNIPHYLIDEASPRVQYSVARFQKNVRKIITDILARGKLPIICGGTAHWIDAVVFDQKFPEVKRDVKLRAQLSKLNTEQLFTKLKKLDPARAKTIDAKNPRRLIRALEIVMTTGKPVPKLGAIPSPLEGRVREWSYDTIWLGLNPAQEILHKKIAKRLSERLDGIIKEIIELRRSGISWKRLESFGLEYKFGALYLQKKITKAEFEEQLFTAIRQYAKRQLTWWKKNPKIKWSNEPSKLITLAHKSIK
jgi:tRNA dimethylallyltransferase